jgi:hypothetical protein
MWRGKSARIQSFHSNRAAVSLQAAVRKQLARSLYLKQQAAAVELQAVARGRNSRAIIECHRVSAVKVQQMYRGHSARTSNAVNPTRKSPRYRSVPQLSTARVCCGVQASVQAATAIQARFRGASCRKVGHEETSEHSAATAMAHPKEAEEARWMVAARLAEEADHRCANGTEFGYFASPDRGLQQAAG